MTGRTENGMDVVGGTAAAIGPYREKLAQDSINFTQALLDAAKGKAESTGTVGAISEHEAAALKALAHWRRDAHHALVRVEAVPADALARGLAVRWLKALISALDRQRQGLSLADPKLAADAARSARSRIVECHHFEERLERELA
jgi:hypothetical protein